MLYDKAIDIIDNFPDVNTVSESQLDAIKSIMCDYIKIHDYWFPLYDEQLTDAQCQCDDLRKKNEEICQLVQNMNQKIYSWILTDSDRDTMKHIAITVQSSGRFTKSEKVFLMDLLNRCGLPLSDIFDIVLDVRRDGAGYEQKS